MFASKALKSDKGQNIDRGGLAADRSSSEFSEDDTPLAVRLNSKGRSQPSDTGKLRPRAALSKKGGFVIPRKKKQANELLQVSNFNAREGKDLLRHVTQSYRDTAVGATFKFEKLELVHNDRLSREFQDKKQHMRTDEGRNARELEEKFAFLYTVDRDEAKKICEVGLEVGSSSLSCLGDPSMGVYLCRHADVISKKPLLPGVPGYLIVFKVIKGKVKPVTERSAAVTDLLEPSPNFNCHVSRSIQSLPANSPLSLVFEYSQYYFYEFAEEGDDLHLKRPRQCLPYALLTFTMVDSSAPPQEPSVLQEELPTTDNNGFLSPVSSLCILRQETRIPEKRRGRSSHVIWMGVVANKDRILAEAQLVCHSVQKIKPPFEIGEKIVMKEKISFEQLRPLLTFPLFHSGPPSVTNACQASLAGGTSFLHCDLLPVEDDRGKIQKLVKFFQQKKWAGIVKCPDANRVIFLIPTSQITFDLGITTVDSPAALHVLLYVKNQKSNKGNGISKTVASGSVREKDLRDVNQIQKELKRQFSYQAEGKEKLTEHRRLSQDSSRPAVASASSSKDPRDVPEFALQSNEQAVQWKNAVENWLSRPHPLGGTEADLQKAVASSGSVLKMAHLSSSVTHVPKPRVPMAETPLNIPFEAEHARSSGSTEQCRVVSGQQDVSTKSSVSAEEYKVIPGSQDGGASSGSVLKMAHLSSSVAHVPKPRVPMAQTPLNIPFEAVHARSSGSTEQYRVISGQQDASTKSSVSAEEYKVIPGRQDGGARFSHSVSKEEHKVISGQQGGHARLPGDLERQRLFVGEHSDIIPRQVKQDNVIKKDAKPSVPPVIIRKEEHREDPRLKIRHSLDEQVNTGLKSPNIPQISHGTPYNAEEALQAQGVKLESTYVTPVITSTTPSAPQSKYQVDDKSIRDLLGKINVQKREESTYKVALDDGTRRALEVMKQQEAKKSKPELPEAKMTVMDANTDSKLNTEVCTRDDRPVKRSSTSVAAAEENVKRIKINNVNPVHENMPTVKGVVPTPLSKEEPAKLHGEKAKGVRQPPRQRSEKKPQKISHVKEPKDQNDSSCGEEPTKPVVETTVPELSEAPFPKILSPESLKSPPTSVLMSKAPKVKLILKKKDSKDVSSQLRGNTENSSVDALSKQPNATEDEQKGDLDRGRKLIDSPVSMDISPQCTTPSLPESGTPITVVSSKGRYQMPVPPTATPTTTVRSAQSYPTPVSSSFPFTPPLPEGPYRSTILPQPIPPPPGLPLMPFVPPLPTASSSNTTPSLAGTSPSLKSPTVSSAPSVGPLPCNPPFQGASSCVPHSAVPTSSVSQATSVPPTMGAFVGSPSYPPPTSAHPASVQRKNSIDALPSPASSAGKFPTFPGQQWTGALQHSQRFVFPAAPLPGVVAIPPTEVLRWPTGPGLPRPVLPPAPVRPLHVFPQQLACPPQTTPFQGSLGEIPVRQPQGRGFVPIGVPRFHIRPVPPARTAQITPVHPIFGAVPVPPQFQPRPPFQQPSPIGYWVAPLKSPTVHSGKTTGHVGRMPSHSPAQKHSKELQQTSPSLAQKNKDPSVEKVQNEDQEQNKEHSNDAGSEGPNRNGDEKETSNAQLQKHREVDVSKVEEIDVDTSKEDNVVTTSSIDRKVTAGTDKEIVSKAVEESVVGSAKQLSRDTDEVKVQDSETLSPDQVLLQEPLKLSSKCELASDSSANIENQIAEGQPRDSSRDDSTEQRSKSLQGSHVVDTVLSKVCIEVEEPSQIATGEFKNSSSPVTSELPGNFGTEHTDVSASGKIAGVVEIDCLPTIAYQTEAERKGFKAKSKIYDILRQNAQQMRSETHSADQEEVEDLDDPDKPDNPDSRVMDEDLIADDEGIAEEEKLLLSGEESTAGEQAVQLDSGLRVVQLLELDRIHDQDKERACEEATTLVSNAEHEDGQPQEELPSQLPSHKKQHEMLPMDSEFEDISDVSDEGTPERDLPGYGSVDIEQLWSSKAVDIAVPVSEEAPTDSFHSTVPVLEAAPVGAVDTTCQVSEAALTDTVYSPVPVLEAAPVVVSETAPVDTAHSTIPEAAPDLLPKDVSKPKAEVVQNEADSPSSLTKKHDMRKRHVTVQSQKRKRWDSTSEDTDAKKYSSSSKRSKKNAHKRSSRRKSPNRHETARSSRKAERARRTSESSGVKSEPPSRRIVSEFKGGFLQITILRDAKSEEMIVKEEEAISPEKQKSEEKHPLADVEYSDLEDISPGRLSSDDESPATPPTPETAIPAMDFTHPSLGFWAAPLKTNEPTVSGSAVVEEHKVSGKEFFAPPTHSSRLEERPVNLEPSEVRYPVGEVKFYEDEPFIGQSSWPAEGFFCQTTTSEERDLVSQGVEKDPFLLDDSIDHYLSRSSQESEEDITRYAQEYSQSEVFEYGHGVRDHLPPQEKLYRSSSHAQSRGMQKDVKHRSANRETRYPWKTREESKHSQVPSAGGEGPASASQSATGKNIGCDEESSKHATKRPKDIKGAHSTNGNESVGDDVKDWKMYVFAYMKKPQFENWIRRKNFAAKLAGKCSVVLTPEQVRRSSERWYRRVKKQLRRTNHSSRPQTEDLETSDCLEFDFDDMDVESNCVKAPSGNKEQSCSSVSKELQQSESVNVNNKVESCTAHSAHMEHHVSPGTERSEVVHRHVNFNSVDECNYNADDLMCDKEVSIILKQDDMNDVSTSNVGNDDSSTSVLGSVTSKLAGRNIPVKAELPVKVEQCSDGLLEDQVTLCEEDDMRTSLTSEATVGCNKQQGEAKECLVTEVLDESACHHVDGEGNGSGSEVIGGENEAVLGPGFEEVIDGQGGPSQEQDVAADVKSMREAEVIRTVDLNVNAQHNQGMEGTPTEVKEASLMHTEDIVAEDAKMDVTGSSQEGVLTDTAEVADDQESCQDPAKVARQGIQEVENTLVHTDGHDDENTKYSVEDESVKEGNGVGSQMGTDYIEYKPPFTATAEPQTNIDGNFDKATVVLEHDKRGSIESRETNTTTTYRSPIVSSLVTSSAQLSESQSGSSIAVVSTPYQRNMLNLPALQRPSLNAVTTPIIPVTSCFPAFQNFQQNLVWQGARHACPFTTTAIVPAHAPTHPPGNYGLDPSWVDHSLHAPIPVGCVRSHSMSDDICPPGTENISLEPSSDSADLALGQETEEEETMKSMVDKHLHGSVMDNSVVTALMRFYSEIEEVESSERNGVEKADDTTETNCADRVSKTVEESTQTKSSKSHDTTSDMKVESGREHGHKGVPEDEEMSETKCVADSAHKRTESLDRASKLEGENRELESTGTSTNQSQSTGGIVWSKVDITLVENCGDRTKVENPVMMNLETTKDETLVKNPKVETERAQVTSTGITGDTTQVVYSSITMNESLADNPGNAMDITPSARLDTDEIVAENGLLVENANAIIDKSKVKKANDLNKTIPAKEPDDAMNETLVDSLGIVVDGTQMEEPCIVLGRTHAEDPDHAIMGGLEEEHRGRHAEEPADAIMEGLEEEHRGTHAKGPEDAIMEGLEEEHSLSPIDPLFMASAEQTIFSSIGDLRNLLGQSSTFDRIAEEAIASTVSSLEDVLRQAHSSYLYLESSSCPSDSGVSVGEDISAPSRSSGNIPVSTVSLQDGDVSKIGSAPGWSASSCLSPGMPSQVVTATDARANDRNGTTSYISKEKLPTQKKIKRTAGHRKFYFYVYSPEHDRECEAVKNYMLKAGGSFVDVKDSACLEENSRELKVFIRRKHLPAVHRLANLYQLKMLVCVRFSLFNTLTDVIEGSRFYENIFVSGGALITDDSILKTIELDHLDALLRYLKEQSLAHQKFVWVLNISRNGYKKLSLNRPQTNRDSKVLSLIRQYREEGFITVLQKGYVAEGMPATQRYLQTSLKLQIDLISVYRHVILLSDMDKNRMELPWFLERGIGVMNVQEFLTTFAGEREASSLLSRRLIPEVTVKESSTVPYCSTPEDERVSQTPEGTPVSDSSNDSPYTDTHALELPGSSGAPRKRAVRSSSVDADTITHTRLHILSCVRSVRDNILSQISSSSPSSPVSRSM